ncbi:hypothetical protein IWW34DRAFT_897075 [Fusarium oxysporum f. sp. albedinis]|nr:hypothetical protein IWW34DRAFT_897075 [Fusarium oxysporum f. sp. albedinis]KAJ0150735.1 Uncharacterized protein HZ326_6788 [Fusarium oxysporum f. sp. albedinis]
MVALNRKPEYADGIPFSPPSLTFITAQDSHCFLFLDSILEFDICIHKSSRRYAMEDTELPRKRAADHQAQALPTQPMDIQNQTVDCVCLASGMLRIHGFAHLQARPLEPYTPPLNWLRISNSSRDLFLRALDLVQDKPNLSPTS